MDKIHDPAEVTVQDELDSIRLQMKRVDSMLLLAKRLTADAAADTLRMDWLEKNYLEHPDPGESLRSTVDKYMGGCAAVTEAGNA